MSMAHIARDALIGGGRAGGGVASPPLSRWLSLAAAPTFAIMGLWSARFVDQTDMLCTGMRGSSAMSGMTLMYLLMSVFHLSPWLKWIARRRRRSRRGMNCHIARD
jgi:hypothetical protein